jgi:hypothetical protein
MDILVAKLANEKYKRHATREILIWEHSHFVSEEALGPWLAY